MDYRYLLQEENERVMERYQLSMDRIRAMKEEDMAEPYGGYFRSVGAFVEMMDELVNSLYEGEELSLAQMEERNLRLYGDVLPERYGESYANPGYAAKQLGRNWGSCCAFFIRNPRGDCPGL